MQSNTNPASRRARECVKRNYRFVPKPKGVSPYKKNSEVSSACSCLVTTSTITTRVTNTVTRATQTVTAPVTTITVTETSTILPLPTAPSTFLIRAADIEGAPESDLDFLDGLYVLVNSRVSTTSLNRPIVNARMTFAARSSSPQFASRFAFDAEGRLIGQGGEIEGLIGNFEIILDNEETFGTIARLSTQAFIDEVNSEATPFSRIDLWDCEIVPQLDQTCSLQCNEPLYMQLLDARTTSSVPTWDLTTSLNTLAQREYVYRPIAVEPPA